MVLRPPLPRLGGTGCIISAVVPLQHTWSDEHHQLLAVIGALAALEGPAEHRDAAQEGDATLGVVRALPIDSADDYRLALVNEDARGSFPADLVRYRVGPDIARNARLDIDLQEHEAVGGYLWRDAQRDPRLDLLGRALL